MKDKFYSASGFEQGSETLSCFIHYNAAHEIFKGHFAGNPIVPGVCTMAILKALLEETIEQKLILREAKSVKFLGLINPVMSPLLNVSWKIEDDQLSVAAFLREGSKMLFKMSGLYFPAIL